jgi:hypothetical protein
VLKRNHHHQQDGRTINTTIVDVDQIFLLTETEEDIEMMNRSWQDAGKKEKKFRLLVLQKFGDDLLIL